MIAYVRVLLQAAVVQHASVGTYQCDTQTRHVVAAHVIVEHRLRAVGRVAVELRHARVVVLQLQIERVNLILLLACLLEDDERHGKEQKQRQYTEIEFCSNGYSHNIIVLTRTTRITRIVTLLNS